MKSFRAFTESKTNTVVLTFGRMNPMGSGHAKVIDKIVSLADGNKYRIYLSQSVDSSKNPLQYSEKIKFARKMFPKAGRNIIEDVSIKTIFDALVKLTRERFTKAVVVVGSDRVEEFKRQLLKYNGVEARHGLYSFRDGIEIVSAGERDPDSDDVAGMSASKMRAAAQANDFQQFKKGLPRDFKEARDLFIATRAGMGLKEESRPHTQLPTVSEQREQFVKGELFRLGDKVRIIETLTEGVIVDRGPNFVCVKCGDEIFRKWLTAVEKI